MSIAHTVIFEWVRMRTLAGATGTTNLGTFAALNAIQASTRRTRNS